MKKLLVCLSLCLLFMFSGCEFLSSVLLGDGYQQESYKETCQFVKTDENANIYLVKLNNSDVTIKAQETGYANNPRSVMTQPADYSDTDSFIRSLNRQLNLSLENDCARSAASARTVTSGYNQKKYIKGETAYFWSFTKIEKNIMGQEKDVSENIQTECKYVGEHCYIFADSKNSRLGSKGINLSDSEYKKLGEKFDACYELEVSVNGHPFYRKYNDSYFVPCNEKIIILVSDLFGDANEKQESGTVGYFYQGDLYNQSYLDANKGLFSSQLNSNQCEMFYIDALFLTKRPQTVYSTLVHEFNHMINFVVKTVNYVTENPGKRIRTCDTWFTEMLSMTTEDMFQQYLELDDQHSPKARLPYFNMYYNCGFKSWDSDNKDLQIVMYANTYAFGAFLARNFGGVNLIKEIAQNEYINEEAITRALKKCYSTEIDYEYALKKFSMCLFNTDKPTAELLAKTGEYQYFSFYRGTDVQDKNGLGFKPIDIMNIICDVQNENGEIVKQKIEPVFYTGTQVVDLWPSGFSVHFMGTNITGFDVYMSNKKGIEYYLITQK